MADEGYVLVVAIDFGTTFSGYAFSFKSKPDDIKMNKSWGANLGFQSYKTPTSVLVDPNGEFKSFGYEAEQQYADLTEEDTSPKKYALFEKFKMKLQGEKKIGDKLLLYSTNGNIRPAIDIFAMALGYLKDHVIEAISLQVASPQTMKHIRWVLTVPAIWGDAAKQFMRRAAFKAKLISEENSSQLLIALEPEAASLYCKTLELQQFIGMDSKQGKLNIKPETKYVVIDAGGGTVDITVHQTEEDGKVRELYKATGGPWGGSYVDQMYEDMLCDIFGTDFIQSYKSTNPHQWLIMMTDFEKRKKAATPEGKASTNIPINVGFVMQFVKFSGKDLESVFKTNPVSSVKFSSSGMLCISHSKMAHLFGKVIDSTEEHLKDLMQKQALSNIQYVFLVGGFGESAFLQKMIHQNFGNGRTILVPEEASMSVLKGAVMHGHAPSAVVARISRYSYAVEISRKFIPGKDSEKFRRMVKLSGDDRFHYLEPLVQVGDLIKSGTVHLTRCYPITPNQKGMKFILYSSNDIIPKGVHVTHENVNKMAEIVIDSLDISKGADRKFEESITFGGTEIFFKAVEVGTGNETSTTVDFDW